MMIMQVKTRQQGQGEEEKHPETVEERKKEREREREREEERKEDAYQYSNIPSLRHEPRHESKASITS